MCGFLLRSPLGSQLVCVVFSSHPMLLCPWQHPPLLPPGPTSLGGEAFSPVPSCRPGFCCEDGVPGGSPLRLREAPGFTRTARCLLLSGLRPVL